MHQQLPERLALCVREQGLFRPGDRILLCLSAGKDSMALYHIMASLARDWRLSLSVFHLNHCARGADSDADENFLRELCARDHIECIVRRHDFTSERSAFEERARTVRYTMIETLISEHPFDCAMTAHTASDQAETVLMRICTGTHIRGLSGIPFRRGCIVRPLLFASSSEIKDYLRNSGIPWREDLSNEDRQYARNFLRHEIIPRLESHFPRCTDTMQALSSAARETGSAMLLLLDAAGISFEEKDGEVRVPCSPLLLKKEIFCFCCAEIVSRLGGYLSGERLDESFHRMSSSKSEVAVYDDGSVTVMRIRKHGDILVGRRKRAASVPGAWSFSLDVGSLPARVDAPYPCDIALVTYERFQKDCGRHDAVFLSLKESDTTAVIRSRLPGDRVKAGGMTRKVKDLMTDAKLENPQKMRIPVVVVGGDVVAVCIGFSETGPNRLSDDRRIHAGSKKILAIYRAHAES